MYFDLSVLIRSYGSTCTRSHLGQRDAMCSLRRPGRLEPPQNKSNHAHMLSTTKVPPRVVANVAPPQWSQPRDGLGYAPPAPCPCALFSCGGGSRAMARRATLGVGSLMCQCRPCGRARAVWGASCPSARARPEDPTHLRQPTPAAPPREELAEALHHVSRA